MVSEPLVADEADVVGAELPDEQAAKNKADVASAARGAKRVCMMLLEYGQTGQER